MSIKILCAFAVHESNAMKIRACFPSCAGKGFSVNLNIIKPQAKEEGR
jgi:hypothetical protein